MDDNINEGDFFKFSKEPIEGYQSCSSTNPCTTKGYACYNACAADAYCGHGKCDTMNDTCSQGSCVPIASQKCPEPSPCPGGYSCNNNGYCIPSDAAIIYACDPSNTNTCSSPDTCIADGLVTGCCFSGAKSVQLVGDQAVQTVVCCTESSPEGLCCLEGYQRV